MAPTREQHILDQGLLDAQLELWHHTFSYVKSMALKSALDLGIADAIHRQGGAATLSQIAATATLHPTKISCLRRLMRVLIVSGIFSVEHPRDDGVEGEAVYALTPASRLLVCSASVNMVHITKMLLHTNLVSPFSDLGTWFQHELPEPDLFKLKHGKTFWELANQDPAYNAIVNDGMVSDSSFLMDIAIRECGAVFQGIGSLVDVAGGHGGAAQAISNAFPDVKCSVMDLAHVVAKAPSGSDVEYIAGDMFESIPPADAVFLKWVMHDWGDEDCIKILKNCKKAIAPKDAGGKVIIVDMVVGAGPQDPKHKETQVMFDLFIMFINGVERDEQEWKKIIFEAGFNDYKITPILGVRSIIEVYP
ncbi:O-methyltransferase ZRP4 [Triticum urartu]|uniref:acetylserotonin O-methyltransferase n=1 Tax=Triticum urartu TaxID=4572 RepID=M7Z501_TRIUA|nr:O-methyltransferase ZRP4-like [Triticum urartu]EMS47465.1 O-methyltransferase ZRP4 [Triticum urartu]